MHQTRRLCLIALLAATAACGGTTKSSGYNDAKKGALDGGAGGGGGGGQLGGGGEFGDGGTGGGGATCAAASASAQKAEIDIIFIVDTSGSMGEEIAQIKANINKFSATVDMTGLDYQVIMIAPRGTGKLQVCVDPPLGGAACADGPKYHQINQNVGSNNPLQLLLSTYDTQYKSLLRTTAHKVFIVITDDNSDLAFSAFDSQLLAKDPLQFGDATKRHYTVDAICGWKDGTPILSGTKCPTAVNTGDQHQQLAQLTGGIVESVCKADYSGVFNNLAKGIATKLGCELTIPQIDGGTIDPKKVVVQFTPSGMPAQVLTQVTDESKCAQVMNGWFYDNPTSPTKIVLCSSECTSIGVDTGGKLDLLLGCQAPEAK